LERRIGPLPCRSVALELALGLGVACSQSALPGRRLLQASTLFPLMLTPVVLGIAFASSFSFSYGIVNYGLGLVGSAPSSGWRPPWAYIAVIVTDAGTRRRSCSLFFLAGLQSIPEEYCRRRATRAPRPLLHVTAAALPVVFVASSAFVATFRVFDIVFVMTGERPPSHRNAPTSS
jgi:multiple sugar transport system permease protein